jgi:hypothetical protein
LSRHRNTCKPLLNGFKLVKQHGYLYLFVYLLFVVYSIVAVWRMDIYDIGGSDDDVNTTATSSMRR